MRKESEYIEVNDPGFQKVQLSMFNIPKRPVKNIYSELHLLVDDMRKSFGETAKHGKGSFGYYLGLLGRLPYPIVYRLYHEVVDNPCRTPGKLFWWKYSQIIKARKSQQKQVAKV